MEIQEIEFFITPGGEVKIGVRGVKGTACLDITKLLETDLGKVVMSREETAEMHEAKVEAAVEDRVDTRE